MLITKNDKNEFEISNYDNITKIVDYHMSLKNLINFFANIRKMYLSIHEIFFIAMSLNNDIVIEQILFERMNWNNAKTMFVLRTCFEKNFDKILFYQRKFYEN